MHSITVIMKKLSLSAAVLVLSSFTLFAAGGAAFADDPAPCAPPADSTYGNGVHHPIGADSATFVYNCDTGNWANAYYTYIPGSNTRVANYSPNYSYDCNAGTWTMDEWDFSATDSAYHLNRVAVGDPGLPTGCPAPAASSPTTNSTNSSGEDTPAGSNVSNTGPSSNNSAGNNITLNGTTTNNTGMDMGNLLYSNANSGNTFVVGNTSGGSAASGDASGVTNIANLLQSTSNAFGPNTAVFTANINGDVTGDFMLDPSAILASGPGSNNTAANNLTVNTQTTNNTNAAINNDINASANSGNATVASNTLGGDATSGNAQAVVNLMNLINSTVASGQSFIGTININGNLNGDILLPQGVLDSLLASTGPNSNNVASANLTDNSTTSNNTTEAITNAINSSTTTGNASVSGNTSAGSATSGTAKGNITLLNLTGSNTVGKNDLLVFVNVLGKWVGVIMNAPTGTTAADLGGGITQSGPGSNNVLASNITDNSTTTNNADLAIHNNVNVLAHSGDATVMNNTQGGNARSGDAYTAVNILNMEGSNLNLSDWFGVLFINVFGFWNGSFGVNTSAGDPASNPSNNAVQAANQQAMVNSFKQFASFVGHGSNGNDNDSTSSPDGNSSSDGVLGTATTAAAKKATTASSISTPNPDNGRSSFFLPVVGVCLAGVILLISERDRIFGRKG
jgi:hypothetical protein